MFVYPNNFFSVGIRVWISVSIAVIAVFTSSVK